MKSQSIVFTVAILLALANCDHAAAGEAKRAPEWDKVVEAAKREGKIVIAIPPVNELRREMDNVLKQKFGINAAKDAITVQEYRRLRNHLEDKYTKVRLPSGKFAESILQ